MSRIRCLSCQRGQFTTASFYQIDKHVFTVPTYQCDLIALTVLVLQMISTTGLKTITKLYTLGKDNSHLQPKLVMGHKSESRTPLFFAGP
jgi:hypothetical protein